MLFDGTILPATLTRSLMSSTNGPPPVLRLTQGQPAEITVDNALQKVTTVHRHGLRIPMDQDGEPYLTQIPIGVGESHSYRFPPQDAGTYWYHPHCNTLEQISRGMAGLLVVDEAEDPGLAADTPLLIRDFRLDDAGALLPLPPPPATPPGMARWTPPTPRTGR